MILYLSFSDGPEFMGAFIAKGDGHYDCMATVEAKGVNPYWKVSCAALVPDAPIPDEFINRLLTKSDIDRLEVEMAKNLN